MSESIQCHCCEKPATVHLTQILNNQMHKIDLCEECAQEKGVTNTSDFSMAGLMTSAGMDLPAPELMSGDLVCESCGLTQQEFKKGGRFGCSACYGFFRPALDPMLDDMHAGTRHVGKVPERASACVHQMNDEREKTVRLEEDIAQLEKALEAAKEAEEYEECARLRDRIQTLRETAETSLA